MTTRVTISLGKLTGTHLRSPCVARFFFGVRVYHGKKLDTHNSSSKKVALSALFQP